MLKPGLAPGGCCLKSNKGILDSCLDMPAQSQALFYQVHIIFQLNLMQGIHFPSVQHLCNMSTLTWKRLDLEKKKGLQKRRGSFIKCSGFQPRTNNSYSQKKDKNKTKKNIAGETKINQRDLQKPDAQNSEGLLSGAMYANYLITYICKLYYC